MYRLCHGAAPDEERVINVVKKTKKPAAKKAPRKTAKPAPKKGKGKAKLTLVPPKKAAPLKAKKAARKAPAARPQGMQDWLRDKVVDALENGKAEHTLCVDVREQSSIADFLIIASGRSSRQVKALGEAVQKALYACGIKQVRIEGTEAADWVVVDGGDVIVHLFRPEVRSFYRLEEVWGLEPPLSQTFKDL